jgi:surfactin synthase thioesterase subunit
MAIQEKWIRRPQPRPGAAIRLFCLPHAGGTPGLFNAWTSLLPASVELMPLCLPGREHRLNDPFPDDIPTLVTELAEAMTPWLDRPWAMFGHSMGATVAHELALMLARGSHPRPAHLFVSSHEPPQHHRDGVFHRQDDEIIWAELMRLGGIHPDLLEVPELRAIVLPTIRNDYRLIETYLPSTEGGHDCPLTAFLGRSDPDLTPEEIEHWRIWTRDEFQLQMFSGGHFYLQEHPEEVVNATIDALFQGQ